MKSQTVPEFWEMYGELSKVIRRQAKKAYYQFKDNPAHPSLHFHRLKMHGELWSVRVSRDYRAVGLMHEDTITWFWIGDHQAFDQAFPR